MRLWHQDLIARLPRQQLLGQHRECCALRGNGWGKPHATVNYVFKHSPMRLYVYHRLVMDEMEQRGYRVTPNWQEPAYRGRNCDPYGEVTLRHLPEEEARVSSVYDEHDDLYLKECLENLAAKGILL